MRVWRIERKEKKRSIPNTRLSTLYVSCRDYRRGISETKKVTRRDASGIALFALLPLLLLFFPSFCGLVNHSLLGCRDSQPLYFLILIVTLFFPSKPPQLKYCTSSSFRIVCNQFFYHSFLFNLVFFYFVHKPDILIADKIQKKMVNFREFRLKTILESSNRTGHDWTKINLFVWGKRSFSSSHDRSELLKAISDALSCWLWRNYCNILHNAVPGQQ